MSYSDSHLVILITFTLPHVGCSLVALIDYGPSDVVSL